MFIVQHPIQCICVCSLTWTYSDLYLLVLLNIGLVMDLPTRHSRINFWKPRHADASFQNVSLSLYLSPTYTPPIHKIDTPSATPDTSSTSPQTSLSLTMRLPFFAALLGVLNTSLAHNIQLGAHQRECFHEVLHKDDKMTVTFQVGDREFGGAGNLEIDFWVGAPLLRALGEAETALSKEKTYDAISKLCGLSPTILLQACVM